MSRQNFQPGKKQGPRVNDQIKVTEIRLVGADGEMLGIMPTSEALKKAEDAGLDLVEVSPTATPPVCKMLDYGKYKYEQQKRASQARKKQKTVDVKEIKIRPAIGDHDYNVKLRNARRFLENGDKVKVTLRFRGREMAHKDIAIDLMNRFKDDLAELSTPELEPKMEGRMAIMVLSPDSK